MKKKDALNLALAALPFAPKDCTAIDVDENGLQWALCEDPLHDEKLTLAEMTRQRKAGWCERRFEDGAVVFTFTTEYLYGGKVK